MALLYLLHLRRTKLIHLANSADMLTYKEECDCRCWMDSCSAVWQTGANCLCQSHRRTKQILMLTYKRQRSQQTDGCWAVVVKRRRGLRTHSLLLLTMATGAERPLLLAQKSCIHSVIYQIGIEVEKRQKKRFLHDLSCILRIAIFR